MFIISRKPFLRKGVSFEGKFLLFPLLLTLPSFFDFGFSFLSCFSLGFSSLSTFSLTMSDPKVETLWSFGNIVQHEQPGLSVSLTSCRVREKAPGSLRRDTYDVTFTSLMHASPHTVIIKIDFKNKNKMSAVEYLLKYAFALKTIYKFISNNVDSPCNVSFQTDFQYVYLYTLLSTIE